MQGVRWRKMQKTHLMKVQIKKTYEPPMVEIVAIESYGVLCGSSVHANSGMLGVSTETVGVQTFDFI